MLKNNQTLSRCKVQKEKISKCKVHLDNLFARFAMLKLLQTIKKDELVWTFKFFLKTFIHTE